MNWNDLDSKWKEFLDEEFKKEYMINLRKYITERRDTVTVLPEADMTILFRPLLEVPFYNLKVVIIGDSPYPSKGENDGLAFSSKSTKKPLALKRVLDEVIHDYFDGNTGSVDVFKTNSLTGWAKQGVLMINSVWTTDEGTYGSHEMKGWEVFTQNLIRYIEQKNHSKLVYMIWSKHAKRFASLLDTSKNLVLLDCHPTMAKVEEWGHKHHFTLCNQFLTKHYKNVPHKGIVGWHLF